jgi:diaminohydroxyphosphoribosylaminopyrimidine deaminase/5-amino-6-(5-phosphoribosylamino)uracil reductase
VHALAAAGERARGATLYVTLEPCAHQGKTPPCTDAILGAGIARVVLAATDPNPWAAGGAERLRSAGVEVTAGVEEQAARDLDPGFFHQFGRSAADRPWLLLKLALSLDARVADAAGRSAWITSERARSEVHRTRASVDAVAVGIGTVLADDPLLTVRDGPEPRVPPARIVFDRALRLPPTSRLLASVGQAPVWVVCGADASPARAEALRHSGAELVPAGDLGLALRVLKQRGVCTLLCEGGAVLSAALLDAGLVDRLHLYYAPLLLGAGARSPFDVASASVRHAARWRHVRSEVFGPDTRITLAAEYDVHRNR